MNSSEHPLIRKIQRSSWKPYGYKRKKKIYISNPKRFTATTLTSSCCRTKKSPAWTSEGVLYTKIFMARGKNINNSLGQHQRRRREVAPSSAVCLVFYWASGALGGVTCMPFTPSFHYLSFPDGLYGWYMTGGGTRGEGGWRVGGRAAERCVRASEKTFPKIRSSSFK